MRWLAKKLCISFILCCIYIKFNLFGREKTKNEKTLICFFPYKWFLNQILVFISHTIFHIIYLFIIIIVTDLTCFLNISKGNLRFPTLIKTGKNFRTMQTFFSLFLWYLNLLVFISTHIHTFCIQGQKIKGRCKLY